VLCGHSMSQALVASSADEIPVEKHRHHLRSYFLLIESPCQFPTFAAR